MKKARDVLLAAAAIGLFAINSPASSATLSIGTGGHDAWNSPTWLHYNAAQAFAMLQQQNMRTYRVDVSNNAASFAALTKLVALGKQYGITIRPMLYVDSGLASDAYTIAKAFAADIHVWELGNELNLRGVPSFPASINLMIQARKGIMQAAAETGQPLQTAINVTAGWGDAGLSPTTMSYTFIDQAISTGLAFDYITYHYYPNSFDRTSGWMKRYLDPLRKYGKPVLLNEANCAQIYYGDDGNSPACTQVINDILTVVQDDYSDMISELDFYEVIDDPTFTGPEAHFGITYNVVTPKRSIGLAGRFASHETQLTMPAMQNTQGLTNAQFIAETYGAVLNRAPDPNGLAFWLNLLGRVPKTGRATMVASGINSQEFMNNAAVMDNQAFVARLYVGALGRPVDMPSLAFYGGALDTKQMTRARVMQIILSCPEFLARPL